MATILLPSPVFDLNFDRLYFVRVEVGVRSRARLDLVWRYVAPLRAVLRPRVGERRADTFGLFFHETRTRAANEIPY